MLHLAIWVHRCPSLCTLVLVQRRTIPHPHILVTLVTAVNFGITLWRDTLIFKTIQPTMKASRTTSFSFHSKYWRTWLCPFIWCAMSACDAFRCFWPLTLLIVKSIRPLPASCSGLIDQDSLEPSPTPVYPPTPPSKSQSPTSWCLTILAWPLSLLWRLTTVSISQLGS